jgi:hypothetical protein
MKFFGSIIQDEKPKSEKSITNGLTEQLSDSVNEIESFQFDESRFKSTVDCFSSTNRRKLK